MLLNAHNLRYIMHTATVRRIPSVQFLLHTFQFKRFVRRLGCATYGKTLHLVYACINIVITLLPK